MSDDLATQSATGGSAEGQPPAVPYVQITETWASQDEISDAIDRRDSIGRVPVVVRVRQRPPLRAELFLIAAGLVLAAVILPAGPALRALLTLVAIAAVAGALISRIFTASRRSVRNSSSHSSSLLSTAVWPAGNSQ